MPFLLSKLNGDPFFSLLIATCFSLHHVEMADNEPASSRYKQSTLKNNEYYQIFILRLKLQCNLLHLQLHFKRNVVQVQVSSLIKNIRNLLGL